MKPRHTQHHNENLNYLYLKLTLIGFRCQVIKWWLDWHIRKPGLKKKKKKKKKDMSSFYIADIIKTNLSCRRFINQDPYLPTVSSES